MSNDRVPNRYNWSFSGNGNSIIEDKACLINSYILYMLARTQRMFEYGNLPESIPQREIEKILQCGRFAIFTKKGDNLFVFYGGVGGQPNEYYLPTMAIVSNPYLKFFETLKLDDYIKNDGNAVVVWNDSSHIGLLPMFERNASLIAETDISIRFATINYRIPSVVEASDDTTKESWNKFYQDVVNGTISTHAVMTKRLMGTNSFNINEFLKTNTTPIKDLIELRQYLLGSWYNELGMNANFNMKREAINESEADMNEDALLPLIDDMLECRKIGVDAINKKFGTNITVELSSSWKKIRQEIETKINEENEEPVTDNENED